MATDFENPPVRGYRIAFLVLCTVGVCLSADLLRLHVNVHTDPNYHSYCAVSERVNCDTVALSEYAVLFGLPLSVWGLLAYTMMGAMAIWGLRKRYLETSWPFGLLLIMSIFAFGVGAVLFYISRFLIQSVCLVCTASWFVNLALLFTSFQAIKQTRTSARLAIMANLHDIKIRPKPMTVFVFVMGMLLILLWVLMPRYWHIGIGVSPGNLPVGITAEGHPWIGAPKPSLEIVEYSDYQCPHCQLKHGELRELIAEFPQKIRMIHKHYPLDNQCNDNLDKPWHMYACEYAIMAFCAGEHNKFWQANDYLFKHGRRRKPVVFKELAQVLGIHVNKLENCAKQPNTLFQIKKDVQSAQKLRIRGTPTYVIGETTYSGRIPSEVLIKHLGLNAKESD